MEINVEFKSGKTQVLSNGMSVCAIDAPAIDARQYLYLPFDVFHRYFEPVYSSPTTDVTKKLISSNSAFPLYEPRNFYSFLYALKRSVLSFKTPSPSFGYFRKTILEVEGGVWKARD